MLPELAFLETPVSLPTMTPADLARGSARRFLLLAPCLLAACASSSSRRGAPPIEPSRPQEVSTSSWPVGQPLMHGFLGVSQFSKVEVEGSGSGPTDGDDGHVGEFPLIGGGAQWKLAGERVDLGLEGLLSFGGRADAKAFAVGGGGAVVAVDVDLLVFELFGGPFASLSLGDRMRIHGGLGPVLQWADWDQSGQNLDDSGSGFGYGTYARAGFEFELPSRTLVGLAVRWSDTNVDLGSGLGDLDMEGLQAVLTVSRWQ